MYSILIEENKLMIKAPCAYANTPNGCHRGASCKYSHEELGNSNESASGRPSKSNGRQNTYKNKVDHVVERLESSRKPGDFPALSKDFSDALYIINGDQRRDCQRIIEVLADGGLGVIHELAKCITTLEGQITPGSLLLCRSAVISFFKILCHDRVVQSFVNEYPLTRIYNFLYGPQGLRGFLIFEFTFKHFAKMAKHDSLIFVVRAFREMLLRNTSAVVNDNVPRIAKLVEDLVANSTDSALVQEYSHLQRVLGAGMELPLYDLVVPAKGIRHDNDHAEISQIQILPTRAELLSDRAEYLPGLDPSLFHQKGLAWLFDRDFRLLREDKIGQFKQAIGDVIRNKVAAPQNNRLNTVTRLFIYSGVHITLSFDDRKGPELQVEFPQLSFLSDRKPEKRRLWWENSKRFQFENLLCLLDESATAIFCTVSLSKHKVVESEYEDDSKVARNLWKNPDTAYITLTPVAQDVSLMEFVAKFSHRRSAVFTLIDLPGIILPSFHNTLLALQSLSLDTSSIPYQDLLSLEPPGEHQKFTQTPRYATQPNFFFDLSSITVGKKPNRYMPGTHVSDETKAKLILDSVQADALYHALNNDFALIQGPPGTGKSFIGVGLIKVLLASLSQKQAGPILCICFTNHALDQLLEHLHSAKVGNIIRIGGRSKSAVLEDVSMIGQSQRIRATPTEYARLGRANAIVRELRTEACDLLQELADVSSIPTLKEYMKANHSQIFCEIFGIDEGEWTTVRRGTKGAADRAQLDEWVLGQEGSERTAFVTGCIETMAKEPFSRFEAAYKSWKEAEKDLAQIYKERNLECLRAARVVGVTTSGLAKHLDLLKKTGSRVLLCEEAGEVLESHQITALLPSIQHTILIGDHQQLRPQVSTYELSSNCEAGEQYALDVSLFERLVRKSAQTSQTLLSTLSTQRRMHPSISRLIQSSYPMLCDDPQVSDYPEVRGMPHRLWWFDHSHYEDDRDEHDSISLGSHSNVFEADMIVALANHLVLQGHYEHQEIAILTPYLAQLYLIRERLRSMFNVVLNDRDLADLDDLEVEAQTDRPKYSKQALAKTIRLATVDNFQGEEADVVLISLVRSNEEKKCGFLRLENRINVLLSRARHGMYIFGNAATFRSQGMWTEVLDIIENDNLRGDYLPLMCTRHASTHIEVASPDDFVQYSPEGGCALMCEKRLSCGHACKKSCHSQPVHETTECHELCTRPRAHCAHPCLKYCSERCGECEVQVPCQITLPCGHMITSLECWQTRLPTSEVRCNETCGHSLDCGHICKSPCRSCSHCATLDTTSQVKILSAPKCHKVCGKKYTTCQHYCRALCHGDTPCGPCVVKCELQCAHTHCSRECSAACSPCAQPKCETGCAHSQCSLPCAAPCDWQPCNLRCTEVLDCGHHCPSLCGEVCPGSKFCQTCAADDILDTVVDLIGLTPYREIDLVEQPCLFPACGHFLTVESMDGLLEMSRFYNDEGEKLVKIEGTIRPFLFEVPPACPSCRASLQTLMRYARLTRRAQLDESTKRFIAAAEKEFSELSSTMDATVNVALISPIEATDLQRRTRPVALELSGLITRNSPLIKKHMKMSDFEKLLDLLKVIKKQIKQMRSYEQPYRRVHDLVKLASRTSDNPVEVIYDESVSQPKYELLFESLGLDCELAIILQFTRIDKVVRTPGQVLKVDLSALLDRSRKLIERANVAGQMKIEAEALIRLAEFAAIELRHCEAILPDDEESPEVVHCASLRGEAKQLLELAEQILQVNPVANSELAERLTAAQKALGGSDEIVSIMRAISKEWNYATGHWYQCRNGHVFVIGDCGMPMEESQCPECRAPIGGHNHEAAHGVSNVVELENRMRTTII